MKERVNTARFKLPFKAQLRLCKENEEKSVVHRTKFGKKYINIQEIKFPKL